MNKTDKQDYQIMSQAVHAWYRFYEVDWNDEASSFLCSAAIELYNEGCRSAEEMATTLIGNYVGLPATRVNSRSSQSVH
jgi:hypothetical protein